MGPLISPVVTHVTCDLGQQDRLAAAGREARVRAARTRRRKGRSRRARVDFAFDFRTGGQNVWHALRF